MIVDGYEQLSWLEPPDASLVALSLRVRRTRSSTSHAPTGLPTLFHTQPNLQLAQQLVSTLTAQQFLADLGRRRRR